MTLFNQHDIMITWIAGMGWGQEIFVVMETGWGWGCEIHQDWMGMGTIYYFVSFSIAVSL